MKRERIPIRPGDQIRYPDRATARWHRVIAVRRRKDGTRYLIIRRSKVWRAFGLPAKDRIEWAQLKALGYGLKRTTPSSATVEPVRPWSPPPDPRPLCPYCGTDDHLAGSPASDRCRESQRQLPDEPAFSDGPEDKPNFDSVIDTLKRDGR